MNKQSYKIILSGGGTGGHIYPAIAIANELKKRYPESEFLFVGAKDRMEMEKVPQAGYKIEGLWISGLQRKLTLKNMMFPFKLISSLWKSRKIVKKFKPDVVIGTGGFASGPLLKVASGKKVPALIQEQNSYAGKTNKWLAKQVQKICVAYDDMERFFPNGKIIKTGNPVRQDLLEITSKRAEAITFFQLKENTKTVLIIGGSLGARRINQLIEAELDFFKAQNVQLIWQCGKFYYDQYKKYDALEHVQVHQFVNKMDLAYAAADVVISRAGASSVSELCIVGKPVIFIPSPNVAEDHQTKNALAITEKEAGILIRERELDEKFEKEFTALIQSEQKQTELGQKIKELALPDATQRIVDEVEKLLKN
ncbi:UDP-N-acetylglucosamine--N-acetylmuramyl- (pentapeptide) pyrophosphoryl-undecaprenol N-acetylglucosamine transferase [Kordia sp. SMS9]|uniref:undecaprenyldiphospho-muramoylpentapeptide beta-N-acetylglucosaminyltransferase n=1 Tax=Kordia sp. SMS9 TaxID=2282170 RepID=UPI000E0D423E|nr:undecaprenyldiphospho-muramoylpentapeptide beta-N-acetylglucosaminyltransferase [Kordia sp. SMS9]AXG69801.1 UDP-N-acetylglucosamine--N-acetylmuramyl- (pentapeptide) pyrophosphoryl-undecaprenol N-acetylglucosamine transferase [Kordia sp. SMS9]